MAETVELTGEIAKRIRTADTPRASANVLKQLGRMGVPHTAIAEHSLPGYEYDPDMARFIRQQKLVSTVVETSLVDHATVMAKKVVNARTVQLNKQRFNLYFPKHELPESEQTTRYLNSATQGLERAQRLRGLLSVVSAPLVVHPANGKWKSLPEGDMRATEIADVLSHPFGQITPQHEHVAPVQWHPHEVSSMPNAVLWRRQEQFVDVSHPGTIVETRHQRGKTKDRFRLTRNFTLAQDTYFMVEPEIADAVDPAILADAYKSHGEGYEDMIVPVAGFVIAEQTLQDPQRLTMR